MTDYYSPRDITFTREQMIWLIEHLDLLELGDWPPEGRETGYTGSQKSHSHKAPFETAAQIYVEVSYRLDRTGNDGETLVWEVQNGLNAYALLCPAAKKALNYISGWRRRKMKYRKWINQGRYRGK